VLSFLEAPLPASLPPQQRPSCHCAAARCPLVRLCVTLSACCSLSLGAGMQLAGDVLVKVFNRRVDVCNCVTCSVGVLLFPLGVGEQLAGDVLVKVFNDGICTVSRPASTRPLSPRALTGRHAVTVTVFLVTGRTVLRPASTRSLMQGHGLGTPSAVTVTVFLVTGRTVQGLLQHGLRHQGHGPRDAQLLQ